MCSDKTLTCVHFLFFIFCVKLSRYSVFLHKKQRGAKKKITLAYTLSCDLGQTFEPFSVVLALPTHKNGALSQLLTQLVVPLVFPPCCTPFVPASPAFHLIHLSQQSWEQVERWTSWKAGKPRVDRG
jgi:hypothetical protein